MFKKKIIFLFALILLISCISADQILWDNNTNIKILDTWEDVDGTPLTGATCNWYVFNPIGTINQSGVPNELTKGVLNFTVNRLEIEIYPMLINCTKGGYYGISSLREIKIVNELSEEYKNRLIELNLTTQNINTTTTEINQTTHDIYDLLINDLNVTLTSILNLTDLTYLKVLDIESDISNLDNDLELFRDYMEDKWGGEDADDIMDYIKDIRSDVTYLRSRYYSLSEEERGNLLIAIREDSREILDFMYGDKKTWEKVWMWVVPLIFLLLIIFIVLLINRKGKEKKHNEFGGELNG